MSLKEFFVPFIVPFTLLFTLPLTVFSKFRRKHAQLVTAILWVFHNLNHQGENAFSVAN